MTTRPNNLDTVHLALELMRRIPRKSKVTAAQLQAQLAEAGIVRELRTIQRQLEALSEHYDIERDDRSKPYGYCWKDNAQGLFLANLSRQESVMLSLAEQHLSNLLPDSLRRSMKSFFDQARSNLGAHTTATHEREWLRKVRVVSTTQPLLPPKIVPGVFEVVSEALYANQWLQVDYTNAKGERKKSRVMPLGLAQQGPRLFLVCRFDSYENERSLALHRMHSAINTGHSFKRPDSFNLEKYDDDGRFGFGNGHKISLLLWLPKGLALHLLETPLSKDQTHEEMDGGYQVHATVVQTEQLKWWLRGLGDKVRVIKPASFFGLT